MGPGDAISWLLLDNFPTDLAAGSVNGTYPEVGGPRAVTDTSNYISIASGEVVFAGGKSVITGDPMLSYAAISRVLGKALIWKFNSTNLNNYSCIGLSTGKTYVSIEVGIEQSLTTMNYFINNTGIVIGTLAPSTDYYFATVLRTTGAYIYVKGGVFVKWTLIWIDNTNNTASYYPGMTTFNNTFTSSFLRIPQDLWLPTPLSSDGFGGTFPTTDGKGHWYSTAGADINSAEGIGGANQTWLTGAGATWSLSGGKLVNTPGVGVEQVVNPGFEGVYVGGVAPNWGLLLGTSSESADVHGGSSAQQINNPAGNVGRIYSNNISLTAGAWVRASVWMKALSGSGWFGIQENFGSYLVDFISASYGPAAYTQYVMSGRILNTGNHILNVLSTTDVLPDINSVLFDDVSVKILSLPDLLCTTLHTTPNVYASVDVTRSVGFQAGIAVNWNSPTAPTDGIISYLAGAADGAGAETLKTDEVVAGVYTNKGSTAVTYAAAAKMVGAKESATSIRVFYNNAAVGAAITVTSNNGLYHGVFSTGNPTEVSFDNWVCDARGNEGQYSNLDKYIQ
jgi:hypothetical protein